MKKNNLEKLCATGLLASFLVVVSSSTSAAVFFDDFEDGDTSGWLEGATSGVGSTGVELHNTSQMAFVHQTGSGARSLSIDFSYLASDTLSFDMHAVAFSAADVFGTAHASSGVTISFLNTFNLELGSASLVNATNPGTLGPNDSLIDNLQHNYSSLLSDYAALAGLDTTDPISKVSLTYFATGQTTRTGGRTSATVWFDNVTVSAVPVPAAAWLFGSGLVGLVGVARRKA